MHCAIALHLEHRSDFCLGRAAPVAASAGLAGIVQEADERLVRATPDARDAAIIGVAQRIEHCNCRVRIRAQLRRASNDGTKRGCCGNTRRGERADGRLAQSPSRTSPKIPRRFDDSPGPARGLEHLLSASLHQARARFSGGRHVLSRVRVRCFWSFRWPTGGRKRARGRAPAAFAAGLFLAVDRALWHESIALVGAGLGTVLPNVQIVFVAIVAWLKLGERPRARTIVMIGVVLAGVALTSGLGRAGAYGTNPGRGVALGVAAGLFYAIFLLCFVSMRAGSPRGTAAPEARSEW
jgi:hypothetical protein